MLYVSMCTTMYMCFCSFAHSTISSSIVHALRDVPLVIGLGHNSSSTSISNISTISHIFSTQTTCLASWSTPTRTPVRRLRPRTWLPLQIHSQQITLTCLANSSRSRTRQSPSSGTLHQSIELPSVDLFWGRSTVSALKPPPPSSAR